MVFVQVSMVLHVLALTIDSHGREIVPCDTQTWILKITDATGIWASVSMPCIIPLFALTAPPHFLSHCSLLCEVVSPDSFSIANFPDFLSRFVVGGQEGLRFYCGFVCRSDRGLLLEYAYYHERPIPTDLLQHGRNPPLCSMAWVASSSSLHHTASF